MARQLVIGQLRVQDGTVTGGLVKRVSPAMVHTYYDYMTSEYPRDRARHGMLLVQLHGKNQGQPWATAGARRMLGRAGERAGLGKVKPHEFRHYADGWVMRPAVTFPLAGAAELVLQSA